MASDLKKWRNHTRQWKAHNIQFCLVCFVTCWLPFTSDKEGYLRGCLNTISKVMHYWFSYLECTFSSPPSTHKSLLISLWKIQKCDIYHWHFRPALELLLYSSQLNGNNLHYTTFQNVWTPGFWNLAVYFWRATAQVLRIYSLIFQVQDSLKKIQAQNDTSQTNNYAHGYI